VVIVAAGWAFCPLGNRDGWVECFVVVEDELVLLALVLLLLLLLWVALFCLTVD